MLCDTAPDNEIDNILAFDFKLDANFTFTGYDLKTKLV